MRSAGCEALLVSPTPRFERALSLIDAANKRDPTVTTILGREGPREYLHSEFVFDWVQQLIPEASEELLLAARGHDMERWTIPRSRYPMTRAGYHRWRRALNEFHAERCGQCIAEAGYPAETVGRVRALIRKEGFPYDPEAQALEDADCLTFLATKLGTYLEKWDEKKWLRILKGTWGKMSERARECAIQLDYPPEAKRLLDAATGERS